MLVFGRRFNSTNAARSKYLFYDLAKRTSSHPSHSSLPVSLLEKLDDTVAEEMKAAEDAKAASLEDASDAKRKAAEAKIAKVFGGRIKGEDRKSSSRINVGKPRIIGGVKVPHRPLEPDNCCMSGCINCVWEIYNDDVKDWNAQRKKAAANLVAKGGVWPKDFYPPIELLKPENLPPSLALQGRKNGPDEGEEAWEKVPMQIRVFAEMENKIKARQKKSST